MNVWSFTGNLGRDAEMRYTPNGDAIVSFSVGVKSGFGEKALTVWPRCSLFGKRAESLAPYLVKGQLVAVNGEVSMRDWQDKEGQTRSSLEVRVNDLTLLGRRDESGSRSQEPAPRSSESGTRPAPVKPVQGAVGALEDDIPF